MSKPNLRSMILFKCIHTLLIIILFSLNTPITSVAIPMVNQKPLANPNPNPNLLKRSPGVASLMSTPLGGPTKARQDVTYSMALAVNGVRLAKGLYRPLKPNRQLATSCVRHALDMARGRFMSHTGYNGSSPASRAELAGYKWTAIRENVAVGQKSLVQVMDSWMKSSGHRKNILSDVRDFGAAVAQGSDGRLYWVQCFGNR